MTSAAPAAGDDAPAATPEVVVHPDAAALAVDVASRLLTRLAALQSDAERVSLVLTGGRTGIAVLEQVRGSHRRDTVDWTRIDVFWSDERFVPVRDDERNERQAREALLDHVPTPPHSVHAIAASDGRFGDDLDLAAHDYDLVLRSRSRRNGQLFDVCLLGVGEEGHVASLFPDSPAVRAADRYAVAVRNSPKPPACRVSLTLCAIRRADEVWLMTGGTGKADAVAAALAPGTDERALPAAGARGLRRTVWFLDRRQPPGCRRASAASSSLRPLDRCPRRDRLGRAPARSAECCSGCEKCSTTSLGLS
jgi:6-phosphogluconolactonase